MLYQPKYCCSCGEKIERTKWRLWSSRRFCQVCETDFALQEWIPRSILILGLVFGVVGFAGYFQNAEKPAKIAPVYSARQATEAKKNAVDQAPDVKAAVDPIVRAAPQNSANVAEQSKQQNLFSAKQTKPPETPEKHSGIAETIYFCGAETKKGKPCSRRVKGGGRCWQHAGQPAVLPPDKLIASR